VDEYQDTNKVQYAFARFLAGERASIFVVGDEDQCLYSWRGASVEHILRFEEDFPEAQVFRLEQNYRSTKTIIAVSNDIIQKNKKRKHKTLFTENPDGERVTLLVGFDEHDEAEKVTEAISGVLAQGVPPEEVAVLYRANFQSRVLEEAFLGAGLPYQVLGTRFFDRKEIKDTLAYLRATLNPASETDIRRIINTPTRGIGAVTTDALFEKGRAGLSGAPALKVEKFFTLLDTLRVSVEKEKASEAIKTVLALSGLAESFSGKNEEDQERLENVRELVSLATTRYDALPPREGIEQLLEDAALATDQDELDSRAEKKGVRLMTVHASKGLEFRVVCVTGLEDGLFPHARMGGEDYDEEEERRLFYVALTRAKEKVFLSYALSRMVFGRTTNGVPSEFVLEIDEAYLEEKDRPSRGKVIYLD
jgi:DNA helicase-2/ATP-dependent DNA helicase PcrA